MRAGAIKQQARRQVKPRAYSPGRYLRFHAQAAIMSFKRLYGTPLSTLLTIGVIGVALALPAGLLVFLLNINVVSGHWQRDNQISLYLKMDTAPGAINNLVDILRARPDVITVHVVNPQQGLADFERQAGFGTALQHLPNNPLPTVIEVFPPPALSAGDGIQRLYADLARLPQVDMAKVDMQWLQRLQTMAEVGQRALMALGLFFAIAVLLVIGNTMRLAIQQQQGEIEVIKLVGATNAFIRRPFLYSGAYYGILGALLACLLVTSMVIWLQAPIEQLFYQYQSQFTLLNLYPRHALTLVILGAMLGLLGSWLAVNRHIAVMDK